MQEFDFAYTPKFFGADAAVDTSNVTTAHGSVLIGIPIGGQTGGGIRPYGVVGLGMIRRQVDFLDFFDNISTSDFGYNVGLGSWGSWAMSLASAVSTATSGTFRRTTVA